MSKSYRAAVIGGGSIGALMDQPEDALPKTHAGGYKHHPRYELVSFCEPHPDPLLKDWNVPIYKNLEALFSTEQIDVVSVSVPKEQQYSILKSLLNFPVQAVIAEKPLADTCEQAREIIDLYESTNIPLLVNYSRRYSPMYQEMAKRFKNGEERVVSASIRYAKGIIHNGSHALDLARLLFGNVIQATTYSQSLDFYEDDPTITAFLSMEHCPALILQGLDEQLYTLFEVDIFTDKGRYIINNDHRTLTFFVIQNGTGIPQGKRLIPEKTQDTDYDQVILRLMDNLCDVLKGGRALCPARESIKSLELAYDLTEHLA